MPLPLEQVQYNDHSAERKYREQLAFEKAQAEAGFAPEGPSLADTLMAAASQQWSAMALTSYFTKEGHDVDTSYMMDEAEVKRLGEGLPPETLGEFSFARSKEHAEQIRSEILREQYDKQTLQSAGTIGLLAEVGAALTDPFNIATMGVGAGAAMYRGAGTVARLYRGGLTAAAFNMIPEAVLASDQYTRDPSHILTAGLLGFALGGLGGVLTRAEVDQLATKALRGADEVQADTVARVGGLKPEDVRPGPTPMELWTERLNNLAPGRTSTVALEQAKNLGRVKSDKVIEDLKALPADAITDAERSELVDLFAKANPANRAARRARMNQKPEVQANARLKASADEYFAHEEQLERMAKEAAHEAAERQARSLKEAQEETMKASAALKLADDAGFLPGSVGSAQITEVSDELPKWSKVRFDVFARAASNKKVKSIRALARRVFEDPVGDGSTKGFNATTHADMVFKSSAGTLLAKMGKHFYNFATEEGINFRQRHFTLGAENDFYKRVSRAVRGNPEDNPHVLAAAAELKKTNDFLLAEAKRLGVKGADDFEALENYIYRRFNHDAISDINARFGDDQVVELIYGAMKAAPERMGKLTDAMLRVTARAYWNTVKRLRYNHEFHAVSRGGLDYDTIRETLLKQDPHLSESEADAIMEAVTGVTREATDDANKSARFKKRVAFDETFAMDLKAKDGTVETVRLDDLFVNDARELGAIHARQMAGHIGFAKVGIKSESDWTEALNKVKDEASAVVADAEELRGQLNLLEMGRKQALGLPLENDPGSTGARLARGFRNFNFITNMGQVGFAQLADIGNILGLAGWRGMHHFMDRKMFAAAMRGHLKDDRLSNQLHSLIGTGGDAASMKSVARDIFESEAYGGLSKTEQVIEKGREAVTMLSGLRPINLVLKQGAERIYLDEMVRLAHTGLDDLPLNQIRRLATDGLDESNFSGIAAGLKKYAIRDKKGHVVEFDWRKWHAQDPDAVDLFRNVMFRQVNRAVQEPSIGETAFFMHSTVGKMLTQFRAFMLTAWAKQTLHGFNHFDQRTVAQWGYGTFTAGLAYSMQQAINSVEADDEQFEKRLDPAFIAASAFARSAQSSLVPGVISTGAYVFGMSDPFTFARASGSPMDFVEGSPTVQTGRRLFALMKIMGEATLGDGPTKGSARQALGLVPNLTLIRNIVSGMTADLPTQQED